MEDGKEVKELKRLYAVKTYKNKPITLNIN
jgi:hypothetical protein